MSLPDAQRAAFLAWASDRWRADAYRHISETSGEWDAWQAALASQATEVEALRADAERWRQFRDGDCSVPAGPDYPAHDLVMARLNNATENYVREGSGVADYDAAVDACAARAALKERAPNGRTNPAAAGGPA